MTLSLDLLLSLCTALAIGLLIGAERGWQERDHEDARQIAGIRTFSLAGLLGGFATLLAGELGSAVWVALLLALAALAVAGYVSDVRRGGDQGMTTEIALLMTFLLGSLALTEQRLLAAAGGIVLTLLLSLKDKLHALLKRLTAEELSGTLKLLFISVVLLPVLPNQGYGPWAFFNPYLTWWMVVLIAALGFSAYLAIRLIGSRKGLLLTAVLGGLVSSTVMTLTLARLRERMPDALLACALLATSALMFPRILVEIGAIHPALLKELALPFAATTLVYLGGTLFHALRGWPRQPGGARRARPAQPLRTAPGPAFRRRAERDPAVGGGRPAAVRRRRHLCGRVALRPRRRRRDHPVPGPRGAGRTRSRRGQPRHRPCRPEQQPGQGRPGRAGGRQAAGPANAALQPGGAAGRSAADPVVRRRGNPGAPLDERDGNRLAPRINLRGYWLQRPGFEDRTRTRVRQGGLAITAERGEGTPPRWTEASLRGRRQGGGWLSQSPFAA